MMVYWYVALFCLTVLIRACTGKYLIHNFQMIKKHLTVVYALFNQHSVFSLFFADKGFPSSLLLIYDIQCVRRLIDFWLFAQACAGDIRLICWISNSAAHRRSCRYVQQRQDFCTLQTWYVDATLSQLSVCWNHFQLRAQRKGSSSNKREFY